MNTGAQTLKVFVYTSSAGHKFPISGAPVTVTRTGVSIPEVLEGNTDRKGHFKCPVGPYQYQVDVTAFEITPQPTLMDLSPPGACASADIELDLGLAVSTHVVDDQCGRKPCDNFKSGETVVLEASAAKVRNANFHLSCPEGSVQSPRITRSGQGSTYEAQVPTAGFSGVLSLSTRLTDSKGSEVVLKKEVNVLQSVQEVGGSLSASLRRSATVPTTDLPLWIVVRRSAEALSFNNYSRYIDLLLCHDTTGFRDHPGFAEFEALQNKRFMPFNDTDAYRLLKVATESFVTVHSGVLLDDVPFDQADAEELQRRLSASPTEINVGLLGRLWNQYLQRVNGLRGDQTLPYLALIRDKLGDLGIRNEILGGFRDQCTHECIGILKQKLLQPCLLELIWSYWQEEGYLVQTMNAITRRFQNVQSGIHDPLAMLEIDPLRPLNNLLWGYLQDEQHRLGIKRRAYEYDHHYGFTLHGKAVPELRPADSRSKFLEAFHNLLTLCTAFFRKDDNTTVIADGFPILNALKEVHLLLSQGAHNQFGDLPSTDRQQKLIQQWLLARPELREFLPTRIMVAYPERWMDRVDAMKALMGWSDTPVLHFHNLGVFGEQILLTIRYGAWGTVNDPVRAANWARFWRAEIQGYTHAYRSVTGVDLTSESSDPRQVSERNLSPAIHLSRRLKRQASAQVRR